MSAFFQPLHLEQDPFVGLITELLLPDHALLADWNPLVMNPVAGCSSEHGYGQHIAVLQLVSGTWHGYRMVILFRHALTILLGSGPAI